jgi:methionyl-tRNA formyltransferase
LRESLKIIFFGTGDLGVPALERLIELDIKPSLIITAPDKPAGRGLKLSHSPIKEVALRAGLEIYQPEAVNAPEVVEHLRRYQADLGIIIAYGQKINAVLIDVFPHGIINLHASLLPKYRGAAPINWAIINGEKETGLTVMQINEQIDAGTILNQVSMPIDPMIRADELYVELAKLGPDVLLKTLEQIQQGTLTPTMQDPQKVTKAPKLSKKLAIIDWTGPAGTIADFIRGLWPWPAASSDYVSCSGKATPIQFARTQLLRENPPASASPGCILDDFTVATGAGRLKILEIKPAGSKLMNWQDFINGRHVKPGDKFVSLEKISNEKNADR